MRLLLSLPFSFALGVAACGVSPPYLESPGEDAGSPKVVDAGHKPDAGHPKDAGTPPVTDSGTPPAPGMDSGGGDTDSGPISGGNGQDAGPICPNGNCFNVTNGCPFPIWIHAANSDGALAPDNARLDPSASEQLDVPDTWNAGRINAYWEDPTSGSSDPNAYDKVEVTVSGGTMNYNITYVDYVALPASMRAVSPVCAKTSLFDPTTACTVPVASVLSGCPAGMLDGKRCLSAGSYCSNGAHASDPICSALDSTLATCEQQNSLTCGFASQLGNGTPDVYACSGYFDSQPAGCSPASTTCHQFGNKWCAALNRGMLVNADSGDTTRYYQTPPYNTYAKWVHETCPGIYAFPYDDYPGGANASGFRACAAAQLDIVFCPGG